MASRSKDGLLAIREGLVEHHENRTDQESLQDMLATFGPTVTYCPELLESFRRQLPTGEEIDLLRNEYHQHGDRVYFETLVAAL